MPKVPMNPYGASQSILQQVKPENLLMAAAEMQRQGKLLPDEEYSTPSAKMTHTPDPSKVRPRGRKLRVIR